MKLLDVRTIHFVRPEVILDDVKRVLNALGIAFDVKEEEELSWTIAGKKDNNEVKIKITCKLVPFKSILGVERSLMIIDPAPITTIETYSTGDAEFNEKFKRRLELGLFRAGG
ncbi:MAG: hypothetical protein QXO01_02685 [Nitrososphaerota archaeon]